MTELIKETPGTVLITTKSGYVKCDACKKELGPYPVNSHGDVQVPFPRTDAGGTPIIEDNPQKWFRIIVYKPIASGGEMIKTFHYCGTSCVSTLKLVLTI